MTGFFGGGAAGGAGVTASAVGWLAGVPAAGAPCAGAAPAAAPGAAAPVAGVAVPVVAGVPAGVGVPGCNAAEGCCSNWLEVPPTDPGCGTRPVGRRQRPAILLDARLQLVEADAILSPDESVERQRLPAL